VTSTLAAPAVVGGRTFPAVATGALARADPRPADLERALRAVVAAPSPCLRWLDGLRRDVAAIAGIADRSYWHPNGFAKLILHPGPELRIRLHVWPAVDAAATGVRLGESNPHSHRWEFASTVLAGGGLDMIEYAETGTEGLPYNRFRYGADPADRAALVSDGLVRLRVVGRPTARPGQVYSCDTAVVHTVTPVGTGLTATLVFQGPQRTSSTVVYRELELGDDQPNRPLSPAEAVHLIGAVLSTRAATMDGHR
jgi:hypothetical protein